MRKFLLTLGALLAGILAILYSRKSVPGDRNPVERAREGLDNGSKGIEESKGTVANIVDSVGRSEDAIEDGLGILDEIRKQNGG